MDNYRFHAILGHVNYFGLRRHEFLPSSCSVEILEKNYINVSHWLKCYIFICTAEDSIAFKMIASLKLNLTAWNGRIALLLDILLLISNIYIYIYISIDYIDMQTCIHTRLHTNSHTHVTSFQFLGTKFIYMALTGLVVPRLW